MQSLNTIRSKRHALLLILGGALAVIGMSVTSAAGTPASKRTIVTISRTMALPGVSLPPGTYVFEVANPATSANVVQVRGGANLQHVRFLGLTRRVDRPRSLSPEQSLSFGEAPAGQPAPITAWYPIGFSSGHQFIY